MDLNPYKSPSIATGKGEGKPIRGELEIVRDKQRAIQVFVAINCALGAFALGLMASFYCATILLPTFAGGGTDGLGTPVVLALLLVPVMGIVAGIMGGICGCVFAGRFLRPEGSVIWKLSLVGAVCFGIATLVAAWHGASAAAVLAAIVVTLAWAAFPHLLKVKKII